jgi:hypothetical protein
MQSLWKKGDKRKKMKHYYTNRSVCDPIVDELNTLEQAIVDICDVDTVRAIHARKDVLVKK